MHENGSFVWHEEAMNPASNYLSLSSPAVYRICVAGRLPEDWAQQFGETEKEERRAAGGELLTLFTTLVPDQAGLHGLLNQLRDLALPLVSLELLRGGLPAGWNSANTQDGI
jgi:hypothetical protein